MSALLPRAPTPSAVSADFYQWLREVSSVCVGPPDPDLRGVFETFLYYEADLLDRGEFEAWYELFAEDGLYWVPIGDDGDDPGRAVSVVFDDHRRLGDRIAWMNTGDVHSHRPPPVTQRMISKRDGLAHRRGDRAVAVCVHAPCAQAGRHRQLCRPL